jgi:hypothetical protein
MVLFLIQTAYNHRASCFSCCTDPTRRQGDIRSPSQAARIAICGRFPGPVRCNVAASLFDAWMSVYATDVA